jgi:hypothetical protein
MIASPATSSASGETDEERHFPGRGDASRRVLVLACGALAREILALRNGPLGAFDVTCLPAKLHNAPKLIPAAVREKIRRHRAAYDEILCLYGDCGTGGELDRVLAEEGVTRIAGPHCYSFFAGEANYRSLVDEELGTFFLTDFLARHFETLVYQGLGLDRHPELRDDYFRHYAKLVYLAQTEDDEITVRARVAAARLGLAFERRFTGLFGLDDFLQERARAWPT